VNWLKKGGKALIRELTIDKIIEVFLKKWYMIVIISVLAALVTYLYSYYFIDFKYTSNGKMIVINSQDETKEISKTDLDASARLVETYRILLTSTKFCEKIAADINKEFNEDYSPSQIKNMLSLSSVNDTEVMSVQVTSKDKKLSQKIAQEVLDNAQEEIKTISEAYHVKIIDTASYPSSRSYPNITFNTVIGFLLGAVFSIVCILLRTMFDNKLKDEEELKLIYNIPSLGAIPNISEGKKNGGKK